jgi:capsular polysaccharide transport system permease protein
MTMKLVANRFRTRKPEAPAPQAAPARPMPAAAPQPAAPQAAAQAAPLGRIQPMQMPAPMSSGGGQMPNRGAKVPSGQIFSEPSDGFGDMRFATARGPNPAAAPRSGTATGFAPMPSPGDDIDAIRREGLTGRQLRMARRLAQKHNLPATSDFDAVRLLRQAGIDPFQTNSALEVVSGGDLPAGTSQSRELALSGGVKLPQTVKPAGLPSVEDRAAEAHIAEVSRIQRDIVRRRRAKTIQLIARMAVFVGLPTLLAGIYFYTIATPFYSTKTEFVIQQAEAAAAGAGGLSGLMRGSPMANTTDSITVQGYLQSQDAMVRLDQDNGFRQHYSDPKIDRLQRLAPDASNTQAYKKYRENVKISYDPTEGIIKMEVIAADPQVAVDISKSLIKYAEEQVDQMTLRARTDQMAGAEQSYLAAEKNLAAANEKVVQLQEKYKVLSSDVEVGLITSQIGALDAQLTQDRLSLAQMESNANPNLARMEPLKRRIATLESEIAGLRSKLTEDSIDGLSIARVQSELLVAQADVETRRLLLAQSLQATEMARTAANRQTRYLSISVNPIAADEAAYPRAFENTLVVLLIFSGLYLMLSMTAAVQREEVAS